MLDAVVLLSGGMDSLVTLAEARTRFQKIGVLHLGYGQKTAARELAAFHAIADHYGLPPEHRKLIDVGFLRDIGGSALTDDSIGVSAYAGDSAAIPTSYVPFRNSIILSLATAWAETTHARHLFVGANWEDSPGYPDCRPAYYAAFNELVRQGTKDGNIHVETPVILMKKKEIVLRGVELKVPFEKSWSCYARSDLACGKCDSCALRLRGFREAGIADPLPYA